MFLQKEGNKKIILFTILVVMTVNQVIGQTSEPTPQTTPSPSQQEKDLDEKIRIRKKEKELAELNQSIRDAQPTPTSTPLGGTVSGAKDLKMEVNLQTYQAIRQITDRIACDIRSKLTGAETFVIYKQDIYLAWRNYKSMDESLKTQLEDMQEEYDIWLDENKGAQQVAFLKKNGISEEEGVALAAASSALFGATTAVRSLSDLVSMFRTDVEFTFTGVTVNERALKGLISDSLRNQPCEGKKSNVKKVFDPDTFYPFNSNETNAGNTNTKSKPAGNPNSVDKSILEYVRELSYSKRKAEIIVAIYEIQLADITKLSKDVETAETGSNALEEKISAKNEEVRKLTLQIAKTKPGDEKKALVENLAKIKEEIPKLETKKGKIDKDLEASKKTLEKLKLKMDLKYRLKMARLKQLNTDFGQFFTALNTRDSGTQISPLMQYAKVEVLDKILKDSNTYWIEISSVEAGGSSRVQKNLFRYFYKPDIAFSGGGIVEFAVSNNKGEVEVSNTEKSYENFQKASNLSKPSKENKPKKDKKD